MTKYPSNNFDALRLTGALFVLVSHEFALSARPEPPLGVIGLAIFFSVSGYLVTTSWFSDPNIARFAARRLLRIWPGMAVAVVSTALLAAVFLGTKVESSKFLQNLIFRFWDGNFFPGNSHHQLDGPLYTIPWEMMCYAGVAIGGVLFGRKIKLAFVLGVPLAVLMLFALTGAGWFRALLGDYRNYALLCAYFIVGSAIFHLPILQRGRTVIVAIGLGALCLWLGKVPAAMLLIVPVTAVWLGRQSWSGVRDAGRFGDFSYGVYLWAWPVQQVVVLVLRPEAPFLLLLTATLACTFPLAWLSWHMVEKPALRFKPSSQPRASGPVQVAVKAR